MGRGPTLLEDMPALHPKLPEYLKPKKFFDFEKQVTSKALSTFGPAIQKAQLLEERAELKEAIENLDMNDPVSVDHAREEIADTYTILSSICMILGAKRIFMWRVYKLHRLYNRCLRALGLIPFSH